MLLADMLSQQVPQVFQGQLALVVVDLELTAFIETSVDPGLGSDECLLPNRVCIRYCAMAGQPTATCTAVGGVTYVPGNIGLMRLNDEILGIRTAVPTTQVTNLAFESFDLLSRVDKVGPVGHAQRAASGHDRPRALGCQPCAAGPSSQKDSQMRWRCIAGS